MNLLDMMAEAQDGRAMENLGRKFGLNADESAAAVAALLPVISSGLKRNTRHEDGVVDLLSALHSGDHEQYVEDGEAIEGARAVHEGDGILGHLLGSKEVSRAAALRAADHTGIASALLRKMLPVIASMVMGALAKKMRSGRLETDLNETGGMPGIDIPGMGGPGGASPRTPPGTLPGLEGGLGGMIGSILAKSLGGDDGRDGKPAASGADIFGSLLDADGDGSVADDLLDMAGRILKR